MEIMTKQVIPLNRGYAVVDPEHHGFFMNWLWTAKQQRNYWYACRNRTPNDGKGVSTIYMHREVMTLNGTEIPEGYVIDHINRDPLDNRACNLRVVTVAQNARNATQRISKSGYMGVRWDKKAAYWMAYYKQDGREKFICYASDAETAAMYRDKAVFKIFEGASLNFPELAYQGKLKVAIPEFTLSNEDKELLEDYEIDDVRMNIRYRNGS